MKSYSIDTRTLQAGDVFVAIRGETRDGHDFIPEALEKGASEVIELEELQQRAHEHLMKMPAKRIAITGSSGKSTTKELVAAACKACLGEQAVFASSANLNNHIGLPLSALQVQEKHKVAIFELGMNHFGEIARLCEIAKPH